MFTTAAVALFGLTSCFQVKSNIVLKKDGSGTITEEMILGDQMKMMLEMASAQGGQEGGKNPMAQMLDKAKAEARAKKMGEGVELVSVKKINANGKLGIKTTFKFADINKLNYSINSAMDTGDMAGGAAKKIEKADASGPKFKFTDGKLTIIQKSTEGGEEPEATEMEPQFMAMMQGMMKDMRITSKITIQSGIAKTNATHVEGKVITLSDIQMGKIIGDPEKLKALQSGNIDKAKDALKGIDGIKFEDKEQVTVEMK